MFKGVKQKIQKFIDISPEHKIKVLIKKELEKKEKLFNHDKEYYRNKIYFSSEKNCLDNLDLEIVFCNGNKELIELWNYFKIMSSSAVTSDQNFGSIKYMIKDRITNAYLGIVELGNDIYSCAPRDTFIGWTPQLKKQKIKIINNLEKSLISFIINITCCIGLQPMAHNLNIGKLLVASVFSNQIAKILGIKNIRDAIKDFNEDEKGAHSTGTLGGEQKCVFIKEKVIYNKTFFMN